MNPHKYKLNFIILNINHIPEEEYMKLNDASSYSNKYSFFVSFFDEGFILINQTDDDNEILLNENSKNDFPNIYNLVTKLENKNLANNIIFYKKGETIPEFKTFNLTAIVLNIHHIPEFEYIKLDRVSSLNNEYDFFVALFDEGIVVYPQEADEDSQKENSRRDFPVIRNILNVLMEKHRVNNVIFHNNIMATKEFKIYDWVSEV